MRIRIMQKVDSDHLEVYLPDDIRFVYLIPFIQDERSIKIRIWNLRSQFMSNWFFESIKKNYHSYIVSQNALNQLLLASEETLELLSNDTILLVPEINNSIYFSFKTSDDVMHFRMILGL